MDSVKNHSNKDPGREQRPGREREKKHGIDRKWAVASQIFLRGRDPYLIEIRKIGCNTNEPWSLVP